MDLSDPVDPAHMLVGRPVSQWRAYTVEELLELTQGLHGYDWTAGRVPIKGLIGHVTYLSGIPQAWGA